MDAIPIVSFRETRCLTWNLARITLGFSLALFVASQAAAQYGGGGGTGGGSPTYTQPKGGYSSAKGAGIGAGAAAGAGVLYLSLRHRGYITGCVQGADDGLRLRDEKKDKSYTLIPGGVYLKPGQRVELKGQKSKNESGAQIFEAKKLIKNLGSCADPASASSSQQASQ